MSRHRAIIQAIEMQRQRDREFENIVAAHEDGMRRCELRSYEWLELCRQARGFDYERWLLPYLDGGGAISHYYGYEYPTSRFVVFTGRELTVTPLFGAASRQIIVPESCQYNVAGSELGHNTVYYWAGGVPLVHGNFIPAYSDIG